jgi:hypothetical protein
MPGLQYCKLDLHVHTPASQCYLHKEQTSEQIVQTALDKGLSAIAITDHNTGEGIAAIQKAAEGTGLVIFPGVEISMNEGYHVVALFDPSVDQKYIENFLGLIKIPPEKQGKSETVCTVSVFEVLKQIHERKGLAVLAHIDAPKGAFFESTKTAEGKGKIKVPINCSNLFNDPSYDAVECVNGKYPKGFDSNHQVNRLPPFYQASDNPDPDEPTKHSMAGIGAQYSLFKLDSLDLEGLRQCFADAEVRIRLMGVKKELGYSKIIEMRIGDAGFLQNQHFDFHEGLNCLIGGKGVGKSLAIELLRFGLDQASTSDDDLLEDHIKKLEKRLEPGNPVEIIYQLADGTKYTINRIFEGRTNGPHSLQYQSTLSCKNLTTNETYDGDITRLFPILAYSQTEVIKIAEDKNAQLHLIDRFIDTRQIETEIAEIQERLKENDGSLNQAIQARSRLDVCQRDIRTLRGEIASINKSLANPLFESFKVVEKKKSIFEEKPAYIDELISQVRQWQIDLGNSSIENLPDEFASDPILMAQQSSAEHAKAAISLSLSKLIPLLIKAKEKVTSAYDTWMPEFNQVSQEYDALLKEIGGDREVKERDRKKLERQLASREKEERDFRKLSDDLMELLKTRNGFLDKLERSYRQFYEIRKEKYDELTKLSDSKLQLILNHAADRSVYENNLSELLRGGQNSPSVGDRAKISNGIMPRRFVQLILDHNDTHLATESGLTPSWGKKVIEKLWSADDFTNVLALQHNCYPGDVPSIRFRKEGGVYDDLTELSVGQKCTALLIIALCDGTMPVVIDQPEDALDIVSVWEDIAKKLRRGKNSRQFILTTHNSSVAVSADSDQFIVLKASANSGRVVASGAIDRPEVKKAVIEHLEGGEVPYILRSKKYNIHSEQN